MCHNRGMNQKNIVLKHGSTLFLKSALLLIGLVVAFICVYLIPLLVLSDTSHYRPILLGLYLPAIPFFFALWQAYKLLHFIDKSTAFSRASVQALKVIKNCAVLISAFFAAVSPYLYYVAQQDDAPGVLLLGLIIVFASMVISVFAALLQRLLTDAIAIKNENDLTV